MGNERSAIHVAGLLHAVVMLRYTIHLIGHSSTARTIHDEPGHPLRYDLFRRRDVRVYHVHELIIDRPACSP